MARFASLAPLGTACATLALYLAFPSFHHNFDGVACAIAVELGDARHLAHGNHLLYGLLGWAFHSLLELAGLHLRALWSLQLLDSLCGAAGAGLFHALLARLGLPPRLAAAAAAGLALSYGYWFWSLEAQVYGPALLVLLAAAAEALREEPRPGRLGLWLALALLSHVANALLLPAVLYAQRERIGPLRFRAEGARVLALAALLTRAGYALAAVLYVRPQSLEEARLWLLGSLALGPGRSLKWHGAGVALNLKQWLLLSADVASPTRLLALPLWLAALWTLRESLRGRLEPGERVPAACAGLWLAGYALLYTNWQPYTLCYRVSDLVPLWLLAALAARRVAGPRAPAAAAALAAALLAANLPTMVRGSDPQSNRDLQEALWIGRSTPERAWVATDAIGQIYVPYFGLRRPMILNRYASPAALDAALRGALRAGAPVFVTSEWLSPWRETFAAFELREAARRDGQTLWEVRLKG